MNRTYHICKNNTYHKTRLVYLSIVRSKPWYHSSRTQTTRTQTTDRRMRWAQIKLSTFGPTTITKSKTLHTHTHKYQLTTTNEMVNFIGDSPTSVREESFVFSSLARTAGYRIS